MRSGEESRRNRIASREENTSLGKRVERLTVILLPRGEKDANGGTIDLYSGDGNTIVCGEMLGMNGVGHYIAGIRSSEVKECKSVRVGPLSSSFVGEWIGGGVV